MLRYTARVALTDARRLADRPERSAAEELAAAGLEGPVHVTVQPPTSRPLLHLDGAGGPVVNTSVLTTAAPSYSPDHRHLVSSTVLGVGPHAADETSVRMELARIYAVDTRDWVHLVTTPVPSALCAFDPPTPTRLRQPTALGDGIFVAGDHCDTPSIQGALVSGRRAAGAILRTLGVRSAAA